jgi:di/tricarboxylate transporter
MTGEDLFVGILVGFLIMLLLVMILFWAQQRMIKESVHNPEKFKVRQEEYKRRLINGDE